MPKNKDLKRLTRARMGKTGESYTTARARLLEKKGRRDTEAPQAEPERDLAALAGMSDAAVEKATGCDWQRWVWVLDRLGAHEMPHKEIAELVHEKWKVDGWWAQTVAVGYERIHGLRAVGQRRGGSWEMSKSKTLPVPVERLYRAFRDAGSRERWLPGAELEVRKATKDRSMRVTWTDGSSVEVYFYPKGEDKSQVSIQHRKLPDEAARDAMREYWTERVAALAELLAS